MSVRGASRPGAGGAPTACALHAAAGHRRRAGRCSSPSAHLEAAVQALAGEPRAWGLAARRGGRWWRGGRGRRSAAVVAVVWLGMALFGALALRVDRVAHGRPAAGRAGCAPRWDRSTRSPASMSCSWPPCARAGPAVAPATRASPHRLCRAQRLVRDAEHGMRRRRGRGGAQRAWAAGHGAPLFCHLI